MAKKFQKILISTIIFAMTFVNYGLPLQSIASEGRKLFNFSFFHKEEIALEAYFDEDLENTEKVLNVNDTARLTIDVNPLIEGYLGEGSLELNLKNGNENNFVIKSVSTLEQEEEKENLFNSVVKIEDEENKKEDEVVPEKETETEKVKDSKVEKETEKVENSVVEKESVENVEISNEATQTFSSSIFDTAKNLFLDSSLAPEAANTNSTENSNTVSENETTSVEPEEVKEENEKVAETLEEEKTEDVENKEEVKVEESEVEEVAEIEIEESYEVKLKNENEIQLKNIIEDTKIFVDIEYKQNDKLNVEDLYSEIMVSLKGNYIDEDLETIEIFKEKEITVGWEYTNEVKASANYTKVSPFTVGENFGTIVENVITVKRESQDEKTLPIKNSNIKIEIPKINDKLPKEISVSAGKLMATLGKESVSAKSIRNCYAFDEENGVLEININNNKLALGNGEDIFNITCRYEDYIEDEKIKLNQNVLVEIEEYSSNQNVIQEKEIIKEQEIEVKAGELISYFVSDTEEKINKGKINANYYLENKYETEFSNVINLNVLTSDILDEILIQPSIDTYVDKEGNVLDASGDVKYKGVRFKTVEIQEMLEKGSTIDLLDGEGNVFHTISKENSICAITFSEKIDTVNVRINEIHTNGTIKVEFVKAIETSAYAPEEFKNFTKVSSALDMSVKYAGLEERFSLPKVNVERSFSESYTKANITMDREFLSATKDNTNVELKIVLNNDKTESDLYTNPIFEIVFPSYIKDVTINNVYMLYKNGLSIKEYKVFKEEGVCKAQVILEGKQEGFDFSEITNGTNIVLNTNIIINDVTPQKEDEIKLYYYNETVSNYQTQTHVGESLYGYDSTTFEYQTPVGLIVMNSISNYNEENKTINSIKQGEILENIAREAEAKVATMELTAVNNTKEECIETVFLGRIPFNGNKDVETDKDLGCNIDTVMKTGIIADESNTNSVTIYYSHNPNATKDLNDKDNAWAENASNIEEVKSYLIVVNDVIKPNDVLKFRYDFQIPGNLGYDAKIVGSFGAFYNKKMEALVMFDSSIADTVGLVTEVGAKVEAKLEASVKSGDSVRECEFITYKVIVTNSGSLLAENIQVTCPIPEYAQLYVYSGNNGYGNNNYVSDNAKTKEFTIDRLEPGEERTFEYVVKASQIPDVVAYYSVLTGQKIEQDDKGYFYYKEAEHVHEETVEQLEEQTEDQEEVNTSREKVYVEDVPQLYVQSSAIVKIANVAEEVKTNEIKNPLVDSNFDIEVNTEWPSPLTIGETFLYMSTIKNITGEKQNNVLVECKLPNTVEYIEPEVYIYSNIEKTYDYNNVFYNKDNHTVEFLFDSMEPEEIVNAYARVKVIKGSREQIDNYYLVTSEDKKETKSSIISRMYAGPALEVKHETNITGNEVLEGENVEFKIIIENTGNAGIKNIEIYDEISQNLINPKANIVGDIEERVQIKDGKIDRTVLTLQAEKKFELVISGKAANVDENEIKQISNKATINTEHCGRVETEEIVLDIKNNPAVVDGSEEEKSDESKADENAANGNQPDNNEGSNNGANNNQDNVNQDGTENKPQDGNQDNVGNDNPPTGNNNGNDNAGSSDQGNNQDNNNQGNNNQGNSNQGNNNQGNNNQENNGQPNNQVNDEEEKEPEVKKTYIIQGSIWLDEDRNGKKDSSEKGISAAKVQLLKAGKEVKTVTTSSSGVYKFSGLEPGNYSLVYVYNEDVYKLTSYGASGVEEPLQSKAIKNTDGKAVSNNIEIVDKDVFNYNVGFVKNDKFDLQIEKFVTKATVTTDGKDTNYNFDNEKLGKIEIKARNVEKSQVTLEYKIVVTNKGDFAGNALSIVDYIPEGMELAKNKNEGWYLGSDGSVYNETLKNIEIKPGEKKELKLVLVKKMTKDNTGVISNKVSIAKTDCDSAVETDKDNNTNTQEMIITISTGAAQISLTLIFIIAAVVALRSKFVISNKKVKKLYR